MKKKIVTATLSALLTAFNAFSQQITSLTNYALNANGHDIIRDIGVTQDYTKITVGSYQPSTNSPYDGFIWSDQTDDNYDWRVTVHGSGNDEINACDVRRFWNGSEYVEEIYVTGYFTGTVTFTRTTWGLPYGYVLDFFTMNSPYGSNDCTYFVAKFNRTGGLVWIQYSGNTTQANTEIGNDVDVCEVGSEVQTLPDSSEAILISIKVLLRPRKYFPRRAGTVHSQQSTLTTEVAQHSRGCAQ
jgi:hypothetical protein